MTQRERFEAWFSDNGQWPQAVERRGDGYLLMQAQSAWEVWQAAQPPLDPTPEMIESGAQALVQWACDGLTWPDSWSALDVQSARRDAEKAYRAMIWEHMKQ